LHVAAVADASPNIHRQPVALVNGTAPSGGAGVNGVALTSRSYSRWSERARCCWLSGRSAVRTVVCVTNGIYLPHVREKREKMDHPQTPTSLAGYIRATIDWNPAKDFDLDLARITGRFPDTTEADFDHALTRVAAELRQAGRRASDQTLLDQADAFDDLTPEWVERLRGRA
jgi:hypothetical protein